MHDGWSNTGTYRLNVEYYGADFPVEMLVQRILQDEFIIPSFQREYVWDVHAASRFIESLLLGLPTPALFLAKDKFSNRYIVIDGQQRLRTLQYFFQGTFPTGAPFRMRSHVSELDGRGYADLSLSERRSLNNALIHCIIISDDYDAVGMFHLFERLNTTGTPLQPQEIRNAIYHGSLTDMLVNLADAPSWREMLPRKMRKSESQELILRFFALLHERDKYEGKMVDFLNRYMLDKKDVNPLEVAAMKETFMSTVEALRSCVGATVFEYRGRFNRSFAETVMLVIAAHNPDEPNCERIRMFRESLVTNNEFYALTRNATTGRGQLLKRINLGFELYRAVE